jgi:EpsI family protein
MIRRRELLIGGVCVLGAIGGHLMRPTKHVSLLGDRKLAVIVPPAFGDWRSEDVGDPLAVNGPGTLSAKLYNQLLVRAYTNSVSGHQVMVLLAYGGQQTDELQLHRPEVCYPAFGYKLVHNEPTDVPVGVHASIPARRLIAEAEERTESIIYWSRMGEFLPRDGGQQREDRLRIAMEGIIPDGLLCRFSAIRAEEGSAWGQIEAFLPEFLHAIPPDARKALIGTKLAESMRGRAPAPKA